MHLTKRLKYSSERSEQEILQFFIYQKRDHYCIFVSTIRHIFVSMHVAKIFKYSSERSQQETSQFHLSKRELVSYFLLVQQDIFVGLHVPKRYKYSSERSELKKKYSSKRSEREIWKLYLKKSAIIFCRYNKTYFLACMI